MGNEVTKPSQAGNSALRKMKSVSLVF